MAFSLLLHFNQITDHPRALAKVSQAWQKHFRIPLLLFRGKGPGQKVSSPQLKKLMKFGPKETELALKFKESLKRDAAKLEVTFTNPAFVEDWQDEDFADLNILSAQLSDDWFRQTGAAAAEQAVVGFIADVAEIGKLKDAEFEHDDVAFNSPGHDLCQAVAREYGCIAGHIFFANAKMTAAYAAADWKRAGFQIHAKWKYGWLVGLPLDFEPTTVEGGWRLFDALENLGAFARGQVKPNLLKVSFLSLQQAGDFLATYEKKLGKVFGGSYGDGIRANDDSTPFGAQPVSALPAAKSKITIAKDVVDPTPRSPKKIQPVPAVPHQSELDEIFGDFSRAFMGKLKGATPIAFAPQLARAQLDYSLAGLKLVDTYLTHLHNHKKKISDADWESTVLYGGAYVGEVIRRATNGHFRWIDYEEYIPAHPEMQALIPERNSATCAFLVDDEDTMFMPLNKVARFIDEGPEHSVHYFAHVSIQDAQPASRKPQRTKKRAKK